MLSDIFYWIMVAFFFTHELDAIKRHEWRVLPLTRVFPEKMGEQIFIWAHIPLFFAIFWFSIDGTDAGFPIFLSIFSIIHIGLHWVFRKHPAYEFNNSSSWSLIVGTGVFGLLHLAVVAL